MSRSWNSDWDATDLTVTTSSSLPPGIICVFFLISPKIRNGLEVTASSSPSGIFCFFFKFHQNFGNRHDGYHRLLAIGDHLFVLCSVLCACVRYDMYMYMYMTWLSKSWDILLATGIHTLFLSPPRSLSFSLTFTTGDVLCLSLSLTHSHSHTLSLPVTWQSHVQKFAIQTLKPKPPHLKKGDEGRDIASHVQPFGMPQK